MSTTWELYLEYAYTQFAPPEQVDAESRKAPMSPAAACSGGASHLRMAPNMSIIRVNKTNKYSVISNEPLNDKRLSWQARGIMAYILTKPDDWVVRNKDLENSGPAGRDKIQRIFSELKGLGYISRSKERQEDGTYIWVTDVYESPSLNPTYGGTSKEQSSIYGKPAMATIDALTVDGSTVDGKPVDIVSTDLPSTDSPNTKSSTFKEATNHLPDNGKHTKKSKRSNSTPPSVELTRRITHRYPPKKLHGMIERAVGDDFASLLKWGRIVKEWIGSGYNPMNYTGMINVFRNGWNHHQRKEEKYVTPGVAMIMKRAQQRAEAER